MRLWAFLAFTLIVGVSACVKEPEEPGAKEAAATVIEPFSAATSCTEAGCSVIWPGPGQNIPHFNVYRRATSTSIWHLIGRVEVSGQALGEFRFDDHSVTRGMSYQYGVTAVNHYQTESRIVEAAAVTVP
jgi:hypothetical protein